MHGTMSLKFMEIYLNFVNGLFFCVLKIKEMVNLS